jgi:hypothetical protein
LRSLPAIVPSGFPLSPWGQNAEAGLQVPVYYRMQALLTWG